MFKMAGEEIFRSETSSSSIMEKALREHRRNLVKTLLTNLGYSHYQQASGLRKVLWGIILSCMLCFIMRMIYLSFRAENHSQVSDVHTVNREKISFPTVTLCNINPVYTEEKYKNFPINITKKEFLNFYIQVFDNSGERLIFDKKFVNGIHRRLSSRGFKSYRDILHLFEIYEDSDFIKSVFAASSCRFNSMPCNLTAHVRTVFRYSFESMCRQFNHYEKGKTGLISRTTGIRTGLNMYWDASGKQYYKAHDNHWGLKGMVMEIHPYGTPHHLIDHKNFIYLEPGTFTFIELEQIETHLLHPPFIPGCETKEFKIITGYPYSKVMCEVDCLLQKQLNQCNCISDEFSDYVHPVRFCNLTEMQCTFRVSERSCHVCPPECHPIQYHVTKSRLGVGDDTLLKLARAHMELSHNKTRQEAEDYVKENIVAFRVRFKTLEVEVRTHREAVPWYDRLSMLGGAMGLLLGFSLITGFEFLFFLFDYIYSMTPRFAASLRHQHNIEEDRACNATMSEKRRRFTASTLCGHSSMD